MNKAVIIFVLLALGFAPAFGSAQRESAQTAPKEKVTLSVATWATEATGELTNLKKVVALFNEKHPNISAEAIHIPGGDAFVQKILSMVASGTAPNVFHVNSGTMLLGFIRQNSVMQIDSLVQKSPDVKLDDYYPEQRKYWIVDGKTYGIPRSMQVYLIYYNVDMFKDQGVPFPKDNWTWQDFLDTAKKLTKDRNGDGKIDQWGYGDTQAAMVPTWFASNGATYFNDNVTSSTLDTKNAVEVAQFYQALRGSNAVAPRAEVTADQGTDAMFTSGKIGMFMVGTWNLSFWQPKSVVPFEWNIAYPPRGPSGSYGAAGFAGGYCIPSNVKNLNETWEFYKFLVGETYQRIVYVEPLLGLPTLKSLGNHPVYSNASLRPKDKYVALTLAGLVKYPSYWNVDLGQKIDNSLKKYHDSLILGTIPAAQAAATATQEINSFLKSR